MEIAIQQQDEISIVALSGELNSQTASLAQERLTPLVEPGCRVVLDLGQVSYMSSAGLRTLLLLYRKINGAHGRVVLARLTEMVHDTMQITGFLDFFDAYDSVESGIAALRVPDGRA